MNYIKIIKYLFGFVLVIGLGISAWFYYPQYQIHKMKKQTVDVSTDTTKVSYIKYFQNSDANQLYHLAIGDSVIRGVGASENEDLVYKFSNKLETEVHKQIQFKNEGINGITSGELKNMVQEGKFDEEIKKSDIVTVNVGGNDILRMARSRDFDSVFKAFDHLQSNFSSNLSDISARIHKINPNATIVFLELYNPLAPDDQLYPLADKLLPTWNLKIYKVAKDYPASMVIETTKVINGKNMQNLSSDGVHPSSQGYTAISEQMIYQFSHQYKKNSV